MDKSLHLDQRTSAELAAIIVEAGLILQQRSSQPAHDSSPTNKIPANQRSSSVEQTSDRWQQWQPDGEWQQGTDQGAQPYRFSGIRKALYKQPPPRRSAERSEACPEGGPAPKSKAPPPARGSAERAQAYPEGGPPEPNLQSPPPETFAAYAQAGPPEQRSKGPPPPAAPSSAERSEGFPKGGSQQFQGPNYKMPPPQSPRTIERIQNAGKMETLTATVRRIHAIQASGLEFGWVFALDLPQNFEKKNVKSQSHRLYLVLHSDKSDTLLNKFVDEEEDRIWCKEFTRICWNFVQTSAELAEAWLDGNGPWSGQHHLFQRQPAFEPLDERNLPRFFRRGRPPAKHPQTQPPPNTHQ